MKLNNGNSERSKKSGQKKPGGLWKPVLLLTVIISLFVLAQVFGLGEKLGVLRTWIESMGSMGPAIFILIYVAATVAALPGSAITVAAGALFGSVEGVIYVSAGSTIGATLSFIISRFFARGPVEKWLNTKEKFLKLDKLTEQHGAMIVALTRLVPIFPFNVLNYGFGLTRVRLSTYVFWSWLCMLPGTVLYVVGTDAVMTGISKGEVPWKLAGIVLVVISILALLTKYAKKRIGEKENTTIITS